MKRLALVLVVVVLFVSCMSFSFPVVPEKGAVDDILVPFVEKYGPYDGYQIQHILNDPEQGERVVVVFVWKDDEVYLVVSYFAGEWYVMETNG